MAEKQDFGGLPAALDLSKLPLYGTTDEQIKELRDAQQQALSALEQRYSQPNWFKVAAGFAKPQLGGFIASLGSASEALGENVEQQRAQQLPIAQMRASLAQSNLLLGKNQAVNAKIEKWKAENPGKMPSAAQVMEWRAEAPNNPTVQSIAEQQKFGMEQQGQALQILRGQYESGAITKSQYAEGLKLLQSATQVPPASGAAPAAAPGAPAAATPAAPTGAAPGAPSDEPVGRFKGDPAQILAGINAIKDPAERARAMQAFQNQMQYGMGPEGAGEEKKPAGPYAVSFPAPDVKNMPEWQANDTREAWRANAAKEEAASRARVESYAQLATGPNYEAVNNQYNTAISLIEGNPKLARKVFNLLRGEGGLGNQILASLNQGIGFNLGSTSANINLPIETFISSGLNKDEQQYADRLVNAMLTVGNAKLMAQAGPPAAGTSQAAYFTNLMTKAGLNQNPETALNILHNDKVAFDQNKQIYDAIIKEQKERLYDPNSLTPLTDIFRNSPLIQKIQREAEDRHAKHNRQFQEMLDFQAKRRGARP